MPEQAESEFNQLIFEYGKPMHINARFDIRDPLEVGGCPGNESSLAAIIADSVHYSRNKLTIINDGLIVYYLISESPRIIPLRFLQDRNGSLLIPGMIFTEERYRENSIFNLISTSAEQHILKGGNPRRAVYRTAALSPEIEFPVYPIRCIEHRSVFVPPHGTVETSLEALRNLATKLIENSS